MATKLRLAGATKRELSNLISLQDKGIFAFDDRGALTYLNNKAERLLGWQESELLGGFFCDKVRLAGEGANFWRLDDQGAATAIPSLRIGTLSLSCQDGGRLTAWHVTVPVIDTGRIMGAMVVFQETAGTAATADFLELIKKVTANSSQAVLVAEPGARLVHLNHAAVGLFGYNAEQLNDLGGLHALFADPHAAQMFFLATGHGAWWMAETELLASSGELHNTFLQAGSLFDATGQVMAKVALAGYLNEQTALIAKGMEYSHQDAQILEHMGSLVLRLDHDGYVSYVNGYARKLLGRAPEELLGQYMLGDLVPEAVSSLLHGHCHELSLLTNTIHKCSGEVVDLAWSISPLCDQSDQVDGALCIANELPHQCLHEDRNHVNDNRTLVTLQCLDEGVISVNAAGIVEYVNPTAEQMLGRLNDAILDMPVTGIFNVLDYETRMPLDNPVPHCLNEGISVESVLDCLLIRSDNTESIIQYYASPVYGMNGEIDGAVLVFRDVTEKRGIERQMIYQASHDDLTGLINRREFEAKLTQALVKARLDCREFALLITDMDQFKVINDTCGHVAGDVLLKQMAFVLHASLKDIADFELARLGGDEYGLLLADSSLDKARQGAAQMCRAGGGLRFSWFDKAFEVSISVGVAPINAASGSLAEVLSAAEAACYVAKDRGRNKAHIYQPNDVDLLQHRGEMQWIHRIHDALQEDKFCLFQQQILPLSSSHHGGENHSEILLRMVDDNGKIVSPVAFISAAESYRLMPDVDRWVVEKAFSLLGKESHARNRRPSVFSINLSGQSFCDENFLEYIVEHTRRQKISPRQVCFEITETTAISNMVHAVNFISKLKEMGYRFSLDDFGSGVSSFGYLKNLPVDYLKIDGSFVRDMIRDPTNFALVESINHIGHVMGKQTIAEYVEDDATLHGLWTLGVDHVQGFGMDRPKPLWQSFRPNLLH